MEDEIIQQIEETPAGEAENGESAPAPLRVLLEQTPVVQAALLSLDVESGEILALVGGYDFEQSEFEKRRMLRRHRGKLRRSSRKD